MNTSVMCQELCRERNLVVPLGNCLVKWLIPVDTEMHLNGYPVSNPG